MIVDYSSRVLYYNMNQYQESLCQLTIMTYITCISGISATNKYLERVKTSQAMELAMIMWTLLNEVKQA